MNWFLNTRPPSTRGREAWKSKKKWDADVYRPTQKRMRDRPIKEFRRAVLGERGYAEYEKAEKEMSKRQQADDGTYMTYKPDHPDFIKHRKKYDAARAVMNNFEARFAQARQTAKKTRTRCCKSCVHSAGCGR